MSMSAAMLSWAGSFDPAASEFCGIGIAWLGAGGNERGAWAASASVCASDGSCSTVSLTSVVPVAVSAEGASMPLTGSTGPVAPRKADEALESAREDGRGG